MLASLLMSLPSDIFARKSTQNERIMRAEIPYSVNMSDVSTRLRELRAAASPRLSVRGMAAALDMPLGTYSNYESPRYKKTSLPLDLTRKIALVLSKYGVDTAEVMKLAGLNENEAEPEVRAVELSKPPLQFISIQAVLPSEAALRDMFAKLLLLVPESASRDETAAILAQWLPTGFAGIGPYLPDPTVAVAPEVATLPQSTPANDHASPPA